MRTAIKAATLCGAQVRASVKEPGLAPETKTMEPMTINGRASYGNYCIERPGKPTAHARFEQRIY